MSINPLQHVDIAKERPTSKLIEKENFQKILKLFVEESQNIEDSLLELANQKDINTVTGVWLDYLGSILGEERDGRSDGLYRKSLRLKISINTGDGTPDNISEILKTYTESDRVRLVEGRNVWGQLIINGNTNTDYTSYEILESIRPVATKFFLLHNIEDKAFFPSWEIREIKEEFLKTLEVTVGSTTEPLQVIVKGLLEDMQVADRRVYSRYSYSEGTDFNNTFEWEKPFSFDVVVEDGVVETFSVQLSDNSSDDFIVEGAGASIVGDVTWAWEINEDSRKKVEYIPENFNVSLTTNTPEDFDVDTTASVEQLQVLKG